MSSHKHFFDVLPKRKRSLLSVSKQLSSYSDRKTLDGGNSREKNFMIGLFGVERTKSIEVSSRIVCFLSNSRLPSKRHLGKSSSSASRLLSYNISGSARLLVFDTLLDYRQLSVSAAHTGVESFPARRQGCSNNWQSWHKHRKFLYRWDQILLRPSSENAGM